MVLGIGDRGAAPSRKDEALEKGALIRKQEGDKTLEVWDRDSLEYNRELRGEVALEAALERGRKMKDGLMDKVAPFLESLRSRVASIAQRGWKAFTSLVGFGEEKTDDTINGLQYAGEVIAHTPAGAKEMVKFAYEDVFKPVGGALHDIVRPQDELSPEIRSQITELEIRMGRIAEVIPNLNPGQARDGLADEYERLRKEKEALEATPRERNLRGKKTAIKGATMAAKGAAYATAGAAALATAPVTLPVGLAGYAAFKGAQKTAEVVGGAYDQAEAHIEENEPRYLQEGLIWSDALSKIFGKKVSLTREQAIAVGLAMEDAGLSIGFAKEGLKNAKDLYDAAQGGVEAIRDVYALISDPEVREMIGDILKQVGVDIYEELEAKAREIGARAWKRTKQAGRVAGLTAAGGAAAYGIGSAAVAAGPTVASATIAAAPVVLPVVAGAAAVGAAGYGAYRGAKAGAAYAGKKWEQGKAFARQKWAEAEPQVTKAIEDAIRMGQEEWKKSEPAVIEGIAGTVAPMIQFVANVWDAPADLKREYREQVEKLRNGIQRAGVEINRLGNEAAQAVDAAAAEIGRVSAIAVSAYNEVRMAQATETAGADSGAVEDLQQAIDAVKAIDNETGAPVAPGAAPVAARTPRPVAPVRRNINLGNSAG